MKTSKDKATELVDKYFNLLSWNMQNNITKKDAIECAKIAVDEIMDEVIYLQEESEGIYGANELFTRHSYWEEVKNELNKML